MVGILDCGKINYTHGSEAIFYSRILFDQLNKSQLKVLLQSNQLLSRQYVFQERVGTTPGKGRPLIIL